MTAGDGFLFCPGYHQNHPQETLQNKETRQSKENWSLLHNCPLNGPDLG
jgi:hypothetical protein